MSRLEETLRSLSSQRALLLAEEHDLRKRLGDIANDKLRLEGAIQVTRDLMTQEQQAPESGTAPPASGPAAPTQS